MSYGLRSPVKVMSVEEMADRIEELQARLSTATTALEYAAQHGDWHVSSRAKAALEQMKKTDG